MAATRLIALHINKGKTVAQCLRERTDYAQNPEKTAKRTIYEKRTTYRDQIRQDIDTIMKKPPTDFDAFLRKLEEMGYEVKRGKLILAPRSGDVGKVFVHFRELHAGVR